MPQQAVTIETLPQAFEVVKEMQADGLDRGEGYRPLGRQALAGIIEGRMAEAVDRWLDGLDGSAMRDRRNGTCRRCLLSELGDIELNVPRTRRFCPTEVLKSYARRAPEIDRAILAGFVPGLSTRKVGEVLLALQRLQGADARRRGPHDRRPQEAGPGGARHPPRRQEGDHRRPTRRRVGALPHRAAPPRASPARASR